MNEKMKGRVADTHSQTLVTFFGKTEGRTGLGIMYNLIHSSGRDNSFIHCFPRPPKPTLVSGSFMSAVLRDREGRRSVWSDETSCGCVGCGWRGKGARAVNTTGNYQCRFRGFCLFSTLLFSPSLGLPANPTPPSTRDTRFRH